MRGLVVPGGGRGHFGNVIENALGEAADATEMKPLMLRLTIVVAAAVLSLEVVCL